MTRYRILRHPQVADDLIDIAHMIADYAGADVALQKISEIEAAIMKLQQQPHIGTLRHEIAPNLRAIPVAGKGVICFDVDDTDHKVRILAIGYAGSHWQRTLRLRR